MKDKLFGRHRLLILLVAALTLALVAAVVIIVTRPSSADKITIGVKYDRRACP